jgi:hypothetical protein
MGLKLKKEKKFDCLHARWVVDVPRFQTAKSKISKSKKNSKKSFGKMQSSMMVPYGYDYEWVDYWLLFLLVLGVLSQSLALISQPMSRHY